MHPRLAALILALATAVAGAEEPLFEFDGKRYAPADLSPRMQQLYGSVLADHHQAMRTLVDEMLFDVYVEREAARQGRDVKEVGRALLEAPEPTDVEVRGFYQQNRDRIGIPLEQAEPRIRQYLRRQAALERREQVLTRIKGESTFQLLLEPPPAPPVVIDTRGRPLKGNPQAPITLVEFADYQCPNCRRAVAIFERLFEAYPDRIKLVFMDFPINPSGISRRVAWGGVCAQAQGSFWPYHDMAFRDQDKLDRDSPLRIARALALDVEAFETCMASPATRERVAASEQEALRLGLKATPTLFVDGRPFPSNHLLRDLSEYIDRKSGDGAS